MLKSIMLPKISTQKILFMGSPDFACPSLKSLIAHYPKNILAVCSQADKIRGRNKSIQETPVKKLAKELGVDEVKFKTAQVYEYKNGNPLIPSIDKYSRYALEKDGTYSLKNKLSNECWKMWHSCVVSWDGKIVPCCFDKDATHSMGDLKKQAFEEIWQGSTYKKFREQILLSRSQIDICKNCTEGTKVWA